MKPNVFVIMPFNEDFFALYEELKKVFGEKYEFQNAGDLDTQQNILKDIVLGIHSADIIIADLTNLNANVFYELGLAHAMNKKVIIITQDIVDLPFDIKSYKANEYSLQFNKLPKLIDKLKELLDGAVDGKIKYGNPVSDFIGAHQNTGIEIPQQNNKEIVVDETLEVEDDKGFLDYITEIEENAEKMTDELNSMKDEMLALNSSVDTANQEINRVKSNSKNLDTSFAKSICRKLAVPTDVFAKQVKSHTTVISKCWSIIENDYLSLLDNNYAKLDSNKKGLKESLDALICMQKEIISSNEKMQSFVGALRSTLGIERKLNQAITFLINEFEAYLSETDAMSSSIDRIVAKSNMIFSEE